MNHTKAKNLTVEYLYSESKCVVYFGLQQTLQSLNSSFQCPMSLSDAKVD